MKKLFFFASAAALLATSCSDDLGFKNQSPLAEGDTTLIATYELGDAVDASDDEAETRTSLSGSGSSLKYSWSNGDAIGVYAVNGTGTAATVSGNAYFAFSGTSDSFSGDMQSLNSSGLYYGYYPYNQQGVQTNDPYILNTYFLATQNYNHDAGKNYELIPPSGSFSNGVAPAVAVGTAIGTTRLAMNFQSVGSYIVVPLINYSSNTAVINGATLTVNTIGASAATPQPLSGTLTVNMYQLANSSNTNLKNSNVLGTSLSALPGESAVGTSISLNFGKGLSLGYKEQANLWFVIPPTVSLGNSDQIVVKLTGQFNKPNGAKDSDLNTEITKTFASNNNPNKEGMQTSVGPNQVVLITPQKGEAYPLQSTDSQFVIQNVAQFIEYAYLLTHGDNAVTLWQTFNDVSGGKGASQYSSLPEMVEMGTGSYSTRAVKVKNAIIAQNLIFSTAELADNLAGMTSDLQQTDYYKAVYGQYLSSGAIPTIGGGGFGYLNQTNSEFSAEVPLTIKGNGNITLTGLKINGSGLMTGGSNGLNYTTPFNIQLNNVTLNNLTVNYPSTIDGFYTMLEGNTTTSTPGGGTVGSPMYSSVTVNSNCVVTAGNSSISFNDNIGLFSTDKASYYSVKVDSNKNQTTLTNPTTGVTNNTSYLFANLANIDKANNTKSSPGVTWNGVAYDYDLSLSGHNLSNFNYISLQKAGVDGNARGGYGAVIKIEEGQENAVALMEAINSATQVVSTYYNGNNTQVYSIIDDTNTSYWTGRAYGTSTTTIAPGTAEALATLVQLGPSAAVGPFKTLYNVLNLNLMGTYTGSNGQKFTQWWNGGYGNITVTGYYSNNKYTPLSINNIYIDGTKNGNSVVNNSGEYLTLLGETSTVNYVDINDIFININEEKTYTVTSLAVAAISSTLANPSSNINITGMRVNTNGATNIYKGNDNIMTCGGLYCYINGTQLIDNGPDDPAELSNISIEPVKGLTGATAPGYLAGDLNVTFGDSFTYYKTMTITNPYSDVDLSRISFGQINVVIDPITANAYGTSTLVLDGFNVEEFLNSINISVKEGNEDVKEGYSFFLNSGRNTYLWQYVIERGKGYFKRITNLN